MQRLGPYELIDVVGQGGMGRVWRARDTRYERIVALKVIAEDKATNSDYMTMFRREAELVGRLNSPHIIPIHNYGEIDDQAYLDMRFVPGQALSRLVRSRGPADVATALHIVGQAASALDDAHAGGVVHRDVKPANLLVTGKGFVYLADFGIAVVEGSKPPEGEQILGSWGYMAPERFENLPQDTACDVYGLACVLHYALTGAPPYAGKGLDELRDAHRHACPPQLAGRVPQVTPQMDEVIAWALAKHPDDRPRSATEWVTQLDRARRHHAGSATGAGSTPAPKRHETRAPRTGSAAAGARTTGARPPGSGTPTSRRGAAPSPGRPSTPSDVLSPTLIAVLAVLAIVVGALAALVASR